MRVAIVAGHVPDPEGAASGRLLYASGTGLIAEGHEVSLVCWRTAPPTDSLPEWCTWRPVPAEPSWRAHLRSVARPRTDVLRIDWSPPDGAVAVADQPFSWAAIAHLPRRVAVFHYLTLLDLRAVGGAAPRHVQDWRAERRARRGAQLPLAYSHRVAHHLGRDAVALPVPVPVPAAPLPIVDEPVAALLADWRWRPNLAALDLLLRAWPLVRGAVPGARLLIAGPGDPAVGSLAGVQVLGVVPRSTDVLARAAVLAFPSPASSGPKMKVLESLASGIPVVTTAPGAEGLAANDGVVLAQPTPSGFAEALISTLSDAAHRAELAAAGRAMIEQHHAPRPAARAFAAALQARLPGVL